MSYDGAPNSVRSLEQRIRNLERGERLAVRCRVTMALVVVSQMLPEGAVKGGSAMALRYGAGTRFTRDLDAARLGPMARFRSDFESSLASGWCGFTGRLVERPAPRPGGVPTGYVMRPFDVKLDYRGRSWCTAKFELGHNEIDDADDPELLMSDDLEELFTRVGLQAPSPVRVMRADHQVAQKIHAASEPGSERARDLVDLQILGGQETIDLPQVRITCERLFGYRRTHDWPPTITMGEDWPELYEAAAEDIDVLPNAAAAVAWCNDFIQRIANSGTGVNR